MYYQSDLMDGTFRNPILFADYSDPDVIRVGDTYYLTASSFHYTPGLPILISKDLVNWKLVNYALDRVCEAPGIGRPHEDSEAIEKRFQKPCHSEGVWAPTIRYHDGMFFIFYGMPDEGIYMVRAKDPLGKWEEPVCLLPGKGLIDSCPFWDEDGRAYIIHAYAKSRIGFKSILGIFEMSPDGTRAISEDKFIFDGNDPAHPAITIEGPKVYKREGFYYILAPAGGVRQGWQVALRSRNIEGSYEIRTVMDQGNTVINGPHQGGLVDTTAGEEWFLHFQDRGLFGRICHLQPVTWKDGWPVIGIDGTGSGCGEPVFRMKKPQEMNPVQQELSYLESSDDFENGQIGLQWQWMGNAKGAAADAGKTLYTPLPEGGIGLGALNLSGEEDPVIWHSCNVLTQKLVLPEWISVVRMRTDGLLAGNRAGVTMMGGQYAALYVRRTADGGLEMVYAESEGSDKDKTEKILSAVPLAKASCPADPAGGACGKQTGEGSPAELSETEGNGNEITFRMIFVRRSLADVTDEGKVEFKMDPSEAEDLFFANADAEKPELFIFWSEDGEQFHDSGCRYTPSDHTWVGAKIGLFALAEGKAEEGRADFLGVKTEKIG